MCAVRVITGGDVMFKPRLAEIPSSSRATVHEALALFDSGDVCFMNCEMPLTRRGAPAEKTVNIRADPGVAEDLKALGVDGVTLANNHMLDYGYEGLADTLAALDRAGVVHTGAGDTLEDALRPGVIEANGKRLAFFGVTASLPIGSGAGTNRPGVAPMHVDFSFEMNPNLMAEVPGVAPTIRTWCLERDVDRLVAAIEQARREADYVLVAPHWGVPPGRIPRRQGLLCEYQQPLAHRLIDAGADAILGNGSHTLHGVEVYTGKPIIYSLGDLIFHRHALQGDAEDETALGLIDLDGDSVSVSFVPLMLNEDSLPETVNEAERARIAEMIVSRSAEFDTRFRFDGDALQVLR